MLIGTWVRIKYYLFTAKKPVYFKRGPFAAPDDLCEFQCRLTGDTGSPLPACPPGHIPQPPPSPSLYSSVAEEP